MNIISLGQEGKKHNFLFPFSVDEELNTVKKILKKNYKDDDKESLLIFFFCT